MYLASWVDDIQKQFLSLNVSKVFYPYVVGVCESHLKFENNDAYMYSILIYCHY